MRVLLGLLAAGILAGGAALTALASDGPKPPSAAITIVTEDVEPAEAVPAPPPPPKPLYQPAPKPAARKASQFAVRMQLVRAEDGQRKTLAEPTLVTPENETCQFVYGDPEARLLVDMLSIPTIASALQERSPVFNPSIFTKKYKASFIRFHPKSVTAGGEVVMEVQWQSTHLDLTGDSPKATHVSVMTQEYTLKAGAMGRMVRSRDDGVDTFWAEFAVQPVAPN